MSAASPSERRRPAYPNSSPARGNVSRTLPSASGIWTTFGIEDGALGAILVVVLGHPIRLRPMCRRSSPSSPAASALAAHCSVALLRRRNACPVRPCRRDRLLLAGRCDAARAEASGIRGGADAHTYRSRPAPLRSCSRAAKVSPKAGNQAIPATSDAGTQNGPMTATHEVTNQPPPLVDYDVFSADRTLGEAVERYGAGWATDAAARARRAKPAAPRRSAGPTRPTATRRSCAPTIATATGSTRSSTTRAITS